MKAKEFAEFIRTMVGGETDALIKRIEELPPDEEMEFEFRGESHPLHAQLRKILTKEE